MAGGSHQGILITIDLGRMHPRARISSSASVTISPRSAPTALATHQAAHRDFLLLG